MKKKKKKKKTFETKLNIVFYIITFIFKSGYVDTLSVRRTEVNDNVK